MFTSRDPALGVLSAHGQELIKKTAVRTAEEEQAAELPG